MNFRKRQYFLIYTREKLVFRVHIEGCIRLFNEKFGEDNFFLLSNKLYREGKKKGRKVNQDFSTTIHHFVKRFEVQRGKVPTFFSENF